MGGICGGFGPEHPLGFVLYIVLALGALGTTLLLVAAHRLLRNAPVDVEGCPACGGAEQGSLGTCPRCLPTHGAGPLGERA